MLKYRANNVKNWGGDKGFLLTLFSLIICSFTEFVFYSGWKWYGLVGTQGNWGTLRRIWYYTPEKEEFWSNNLHRSCFYYSKHFFENCLGALGGGMN